MQAQEKAGKEVDRLRQSLLSPKLKETGNTKVSLAAGPEGNAKGLGTAEPWRWLCK